MAQMCSTFSKAAWLAAAAIILATVMGCGSQTQSKPAPPAPPLVSLPSPVIPDGIGVTGHRGESAAVYGTMANIGIRYERIDLWWPNVETMPGVYDFSGYDGIVQGAQAAGIKVMFILDYGNALYDGGYLPYGGYSPYDDTGIRAYTNYALAAVQHYQGQGLVWEIYNEPIFSWKTPYQVMTPENIALQYSLMANAAERAIKASFPNELVIGPAMPCINGQDTNCAQYSDFLPILYQNGVADYLDAISVHPYRAYPESVSSDYASLRDQIKSETSRNPPLVNSEWGYSTCYFENNSGCVSSGEGGPLTHSDAETLKGELMVRSLLMDRMNGIPISIIYDWMDDGTDQGNPENNFGLVGNYPDHGTPSQFNSSYFALQTFTSVLNGYSYSSRITTSNPIDWILVFAKGSQNIYVCWADAGPAWEYQTGNGNTVNIPIGSNVPVTVTSFDGSSVVNTTSGPNGYSCNETEGPQYISLGN